MGGYHGLGYGYHGYPYAYYGKRSADAEPKAEADPYLLYGGYHGLGYARYGLHYPAYGGYAYYGKRSADAEAKADPYVYGILWIRWIPWLWWIWIWTSCLLWISRESPHIESDSTTIIVFSICDQNFSA